MSDPERPGGRGAPEEPGRERPAEGAPPQELERALRELGGRLEWPPAPDLAGRVRRRLDAPSDLARRVRSRVETLGERGGGRRRRRVPRPGARAAAALLAVLVAAGGLAALPGPREAIADLLGLRGVRITRGVPGPLPATSPAPGPLGQGLGLGRRVSLAQARAGTGRPVALPSLAGLRRPDAVWLDDGVPGGAVSLVWRPRAGLPPAGPSGAALLLTALPGSADEEVLVKKLLVGGTGISEVRVGAARGLWIQGAPHELFYLAPDGDPRPDRTRLAGNTLLWEHDGLVMRLEAAVSRAEALRIAGSLR
ncbi:MAG TPA: hypothetical protein VKG45_02165 [Actinomycetes bacterium]|nr:hypothetical protein [Actinomycetes bacterium]